MMAQHELATNLSVSFIQGSLDRITTLKLYYDHRYIKVICDSNIEFNLLAVDSCIDRIVYNIGFSYFYRILLTKNF